MPCFIDYTIEHTKIMTEECTKIVKKLFQVLEKNSEIEIENIVLELIIMLGPRGIYTMLGMRKTPGSLEQPWPS